MPRPLPAHTLDALRAIHDGRARYGQAPTLRELGRLIDLKSTSHVSYLLQSMERRGLIRVRRIGRFKQARFPSTRLTLRGLQLLGAQTRAQEDSKLD